MENLFSQKECIQIGIALIAGGAMGSILKATWDTYQNRIRTIVYYLTIDLKSRFDERLSKERVSYKVGGKEESRDFDRYSVANFEIRNTTGRDMTEFPFGITLFGGDVAFRVDSVSPDRHHFCDVAEPPDPRSARNQLDFVFRPFNRRDTYVLKLFISPGLEGKAINYPRLSSALPIRFLDSEVRANLALTMGMWEAKKAGVRHAPRGSFAGVDLERDGLPSHYPRGVYQVAFRKKLYSSLAELQALSLRPSVDLSIQETYLRLRQTP